MKSKLIKDIMVTVDEINKKIQEAYRLATQIQNHGYFIFISIPENRRMETAWRFGVTRTSGAEDYLRRYNEGFEEYAGQNTLTTAGTLINEALSVLRIVLNFLDSIRPPGPGPQTQQGREQAPPSGPGQPPRGRGDQQAPTGPGQPPAGGTRVPPTGAGPGGAQQGRGQTPPTGPGPAPAPQQPPGQGIIRVIVTDSGTGDPLLQANIKILELTTGTTYNVKTNAQGFVQQTVSLGFYEVTAEKSGYKKQIQRTELTARRTTANLNFSLEKTPEQPGFFKQGFPLIDPRWWFGKGKKEEGGYEHKGASWPRFAIALGLTLLFYFALYRPTFAALGQNLGFVNWMIPFLFFWIMFFTIPPFWGKEGDKNIAPFIAASMMAVGTFIGLTFFTKGVGRASFIQWGFPLAVYLFAYFTTKGKGIKATLTTLVPLLLLIGGLMLVWNLVSSGAAFNMETYLKTLDGLRLIGVPQDTIDNMKDGVRNVLSFLQFKGAQPTKPEAKKIGGFEAIELKFGSRHNNFQLPTLFARMDYVLPVTVTNPNKFDTKLVVEGFKIEDVFMKNKSDDRIFCGSATKQNPTDPTKPVLTGSFDLGNINPEEEKSATIDFKGKTTQSGANPNVVPAVGESIDCRTVLGEYKKQAPTNPMFPAKLIQTAKEVKSTCGGADDILPDLGGEGAKREQCRRAQCAEECSSTVSNFNQRYLLPKSTTYSFDGKKITTNPGDTPSGNELDFNPDKITGTRYIESDDVCECKVKRYYNVLDELCFFDNDKAKIQLSSSYGFKVQGKGELILVKAEADRKSAPRPTITSSAGPLTVTTFFVSDVHVPGKTTASTMFIQIANDGDGSATLNKLKIKDVLFIGKTGETTQNQVPLSDVVTITNCQPKSNIIIGKDGTTLSCSVGVEKDKAKYESKVTGTYLTVPVIVDVEYTYTQTHSTTINVKKESIPEGVTEVDRVVELNKQFKPLPYYCPTQEVRDPDTGEVTKPLKIY